MRRSGFALCCVLVAALVLRLDLSAQPGAGQPLVILIALDGFRWDYLDRVPAPTLRALAAGGVRAASLVPVFPVLTFPNHYTIVTGLTPAHHGIISNTMLDPVLPGRFTLSDTRVTGNPAWWSGEPIWHTATRHGLKSATMFWPGADVAIGGQYPTYWRPFEDAMPAAARTSQVVEWLRLPEPDRPSLLTLYFSDVDSAGHTFGPEAREVDEAVAQLDAEVARLVRAVEAEGLAARVHWVIVSDHGMAALSGERTIVLDDYLDPATVEIVDLGPWITFTPVRWSVDAAYAALANRHPRLRVYRATELPARYGLAGHPRLAQLVALADEGWTITTRERLARRDPDRPWGGAHGFDPAYPSMHGLLLVTGPRVRRGVRLPALENVHVYELMCRILGITPAPNDGDPARVAPFFRSP